MIIGKNIKKYRLKCNLTQKQLGDLLAVSAQAVSKWERSVCAPDIMLLPLIASIFNIMIEDLYA